MKNVILTHKELQHNLFEAFTSALQSVSFGSKDLFLSIDITERDYIWQVSKEGEKEPIYWCYIGKGENQMNDVRLGVTIGYLREKADEFLKGFNEFYYADEREPASVKSGTSHESIFMNFHNSNDLPEKDSNEEDLSVYVLIDIYGSRNPDDFEIGYYDFGSEKWCLKKTPEKYIDLDHMKWAKLPLQTENHSRIKEPLAKG